MAQVAHSVEYLVDLFLTDDPDLEDEKGHEPFFAEGCVEVEHHDADDVEDHEMDEEFLRLKVGRDFKHSGDEFNKKYEQVKHKTLKDDVKELFDDKIHQAGGSPEVFWPRFRDLMDNAMKDTGLDDANKVLAAVLVSVKGLSYLGSSIRTLTLRYIGDRKLDSDLKKIRITNESKLPPSLD